ncbi:UDP-N-acetylmuramoyl-tripeptide--D-alanyl-D-alanine ligase [Lentibacillus halophilus]|uniref:UDP-N-acetylmuramoyl-tripeptide--D-alanyl-D-alanine ligase n=1 Tax=Lentibacillus halophilus TaxID=295065 RepID=A0ABN0ZFL8_9BACI
MLFTTGWLTTLFSDHQGGPSPNSPSDGIAIDDVVTDSRKDMHHSLFVPLSGAHFDGHDYVKEALRHGAVATLWEKGKPLPDDVPADFPVFFVEDTLTALQQLASAYRQKIDPLVIGVTGSNGKTTTKDLIAAVTSETYRTHATQGNWNNHIGLPLTILSMPAQTDVLVVEMGMNHSGEIETLTGIAKPDYGVITNIGESHIAQLGSREAIAAAKMEIIRGMPGDGYLIIDGDEPLLQKTTWHGPTILCGFHSSNDTVIQNVTLTNQHTEFQLNHETDVYSIPLPGSHHALNATFAVTVARRLKIPDHTIKTALGTLEWTSMRFEFLDGMNGSAIINDAYNASPTSMKAAIDVVKQMEGFNRKVLVLGDMFELGKDAINLHQSAASGIDESIDAVFTFGEQATSITEAVRERTDKIDNRHFTSGETLLQAIDSYMAQGTLILFKASRGMQFESYIEQIAEST